jgi:hypothetical protein
MTEPEGDARDDGALQAAAGPDRTRRISLPPVPGRKPKPVKHVDQPTDELPPPPPRQSTQAFRPWQPLQPRVVPRHRSRTPWVIAGLVVLVLTAGVVVFLVYG